jgi:glutathione S-transferase
MAEYTPHCLVQSANACKAALCLELAAADWKPRMQGRWFVVGNHMTIADLSLRGYLFRDDDLRVDWKLFPNLDARLSRIRSMPRWKNSHQLMPGHPLVANRN